MERREYRKQNSKNKYYSTFERQDEEKEGLKKFKSRTGNNFNLRKQYKEKQTSGNTACNWSDGENSYKNIIDL